MDLTAAVEQMLSERAVDTLSTAAQYRRAVQRFSEYLGRPASSDDLTTANVNGWLPQLHSTYDSNLSGDARRSPRRVVLSARLRYPIKVAWVCLDSTRRRHGWLAFAFLCRGLFVWRSVSFFLSDSVTVYMR